MNILLVDDDIPLAHMLAEKLHELEPIFQVKPVASADAARQAVTDAATPFDVYLLDLRLDGSDVDGITLMRELFQRNPDSDAIILTGRDDPESGLAAFAAGAHRYLIKPFDTRELVWILKVLEKAQLSRRESNWLRVLSEIAVAAQQGNTVQKVGDILCQEAQRLGFERTRLWLLADLHNVSETMDEATVFKGISEAGHAKLAGFHGLRFPLRELPYAQQVYQSGKPGFFSGRAERNGLDRHYGAAFKPPVGEWAKLSLFVKKQCIGFLVLDNAEHEKALTPEQRRLLNLFSNQAAAALARAMEQEETQLLLEIGREITKQAALSKLDDLLDTVREQVRRVMKVDNFIAVLLDEDAQQLDFRRCYERNKLQARHWRPYPSCISGDVIKNNGPLLLPRGGKEYREARGDPSRCWLGVPLRLDNKAIGAIILQDYDQENVYGAREERLLLAVADMAAGAIGLAYRAERDAQIHTFDESHILLRNKLRQLAEENEYWFWHAVLTLVTHQDGLRFNRAALLWFDETGATMQGRMGIGYFSRQMTREAWEKDEQEGWNFREYLSQPQLGRSRPTPLQEEIAKLEYEAGAAASLLTQLHNQQQGAILSSDKLHGMLPEKLLNPLDLPEDVKSFMCGLVPAKFGERVLGVLVVDNFVDGKPVRPSDLERLYKFLEEVLQVWQSVIETKQLAGIQGLSQQIMGQVSQRPLKNSLDELCERAREITNADYVIVYPYLSSTGSYDVNLLSHSSRPNDPGLKIAKGPGQQGLTFLVLRSGILVVPNVSESELMVGGRRLADHEFIRRNAVKALIGAPMRSATGEPVGVVYLDYRSPQQFTSQDIKRAERIADIGADAILFIRNIERETHDRKQAEETAQLRQRAMQYFSHIQTYALSPSNDKWKVILSILQNTGELFEGRVEASLATINWKTDTDQTQRTRQDYHLNPTETLVSQNVNPVFQGELGEVIRLSEGSEYRPQVHSIKRKLITPILLDGRPIGAIQVHKHSKQPEFTAVEQEILGQLATVAALALDNVQARTRLQELADTVSAISSSNRLEDALKTVIAAARRFAPELDCVTLWYRDPDLEKRLIPGLQWGVRKSKHRREDASAESLVRDMIQLQSPLYVNDVKDEDRLTNSDFVKDQNIASAAIFPLRSGQQAETLGVLFLNYRKPHKFTGPEGAFFGVFASAVAIALENVVARQQGNERLAVALKVAEAVGSQFDLDKVLQTVLRSLKDHFDKQKHTEVQPYVMLYDENDNSLYLPAVAREFMPVDNPEYKDELRLRLDGSDKGIVCWVANEAKQRGNVLVMNFPDIRKEANYLNFYSGSVSLLCAGLVTQGDPTRERRLWGVLAVSSPQEATFNVHDERLLELAAQQALIALERAENAARLRFKDAVSSVTTWAAELAHDINKEVGAIRNRVDWLQNEEQELSEQGWQWVNEIDTGAARLVDVTRSVRADQQMDIEEFDLCQMLAREIANLLKQRWPKITPATDFRPDSLWLKTYRMRLWRGVRHLVRNAADAMDEKGVLTIRTRIRGDAYDRVEIQIEDTGPGVPADLRGVLLSQPYSNKGELQDRGYGLLIARQLIESLGGTIRILPQEPGRGAVFAISLPLTPERLQ